MPSHTRLPRILRLLRFVASGHRACSAQLAELLGVSRRTILRDIDMLRRADVPVFYDQDSEAYCLHTDPLASTVRHVASDEIMMLVAAAHVSPLNHSENTQDLVDEAIAKLLAVSSAPAREAAGNLLRCFEFRRPADAPENGNPHAKDVLLEAVKLRLQVRVSLVGRFPCDRWHTKVAPYRILIDLDQWIVVGRSSVDRRTCRFNVADIGRAELTDDPFKVPMSFTIENAGESR